MNAMLPKMNLSEMVKGDAKVRFTCYRHKELWYAHDNGFEFPVPIDDCGDGVFNAEDRAIFFMRYIRKHMATLEAARKEQIV